MTSDFNSIWKNLELREEQLRTHLAAVTPTTAGQPPPPTPPSTPLTTKEGINGSAKPTTPNNVQHNAAPPPLTIMNHPVPVTNGVNHGRENNDSANFVDPNALARSSSDQAAELARKLYEDEKKKREERKRKREEEDNWQKVVRTKLHDEKKRIEDEEAVSFESNRELYALFNDLQGISHDFNITFDTPELVVVGMQSDGKSTFIEGLLGFQFNIVESNIGTRRPLILQMINNTAKKEPFCRFRKEQVNASDEDPFEEDPTPVHRLCSEIIRRTNAVAGKGDAVSASPIILRVEFAQCANLTIFDTPGFRLGGDERLRSEIQDMVKKIMEPRNRIIICLEQSTVEWANTTSRPLVREADRNFDRTILVNTKFDNRVKELRAKEGAEKYLAGEGLPANKRPFFVSMPIRRNLETEQFIKAMKDCYLDDYEKVVELKVEDRFMSQIGFFRLKGFLERLLADRYQNSLAPTLQVLESVCRQTESELDQVRRELASNDMSQLKYRVNKYVQSFNLLVERLLEGSIIGNPDTFGQTLGQEKTNSGIGDWPDFTIDFPFQNETLKLYGGAQYERLMNEFEFMAHSREFPPTTINEVASALGVSKGHNVVLFESAASDIVQIKARQSLAPLIDIILRRVSYIFKRLFEISTDVLRSEKGEAKEYGMIGIYEQFLGELRRVYFAFVDKTEAECATKLRDDFDTFTKVIDWSLLSGLSELKDYDYLSNDPEQTKQRVIRMMDPKPSMTVESVSRTRRVDENTHKQVCTMAAHLFSGIRFFFVKYIRNKVNAFFLDPMFQKLGAELTNHFRLLDEKKYEEIFNLGITEMKERMAKLELQHQHVCASRDKFRDLASRMKRNSKKFEMV